MLVFDVLQRDLRFLFHLGQLVVVLEHEMHQSLHVDLHFYRLFFFEILMFSILVPLLGFDVLQFFLAHHPEVRDPDTLIVVHVRQ